MDYGSKQIMKRSMNRRWSEFGKVIEGWKMEAMNYLEVEQRLNNGKITNKYGT